MTSRDFRYSFRRITKMWNILLSSFVVSIAITETSSIETSCTNACKDTWRLVVATSASGVVTEGSKEDLRKAVLSGEEIRILMPTLNYLMNVENARTIGDNVCAQALMHISKAGYDRFQGNAYWWLLNLCSTAQVDITRYYVGVHQLVSRSRKKFQLKWFARGMSNTPLRHTSSGIAVTGSVDDLIADIKIGYDVRIATECVGYTAPMDSLEIPSSEDLVVGQALWHISQEELGPNYVYQNNAYWWFTQWITNGNLHMSRWELGDHEPVSGEPTHQRHMTWHTDSCWELAYKHDDVGNRLDGSLECLRFSLLNGHRVKLVFEEDSSTINVEPDELNICGDHVNAVVLRMLKKDSADVTMFDDVAQWYMRILTTTGTETSVKVKVGEYEELARTVGTRAVSWYTDTRSWPRVLSNDKNGNVQSGSKSDLVASIKAGRKIRYSLKYPGSDCVVVHTADNLAIRGSQVGAKHVRSMGLQNTPGSPEEVSFLADLYWRFTIASTTGTVAVTQWTVGERTNKGRSIVRAAMDWFVNF